MRLLEPYYEGSFAEECKCCGMWVDEESVCLCDTGDCPNCWDEWDEAPEIEFYDPGSNSALRAGVREFPCPTCKEPNRLTAEDVRLGYQCDACANALERGY